jgi:hypothetical protein
VIGPAQAFAALANPGAHTQDHLRARKMRFALLPGHDETETPVQARLHFASRNL